VIRPTLCALGALSLFLAAASSSLAKPQLVVQKTAKGPHDSIVYISHPLTPGHRYRVDVSAPRAESFTGHAIEDFFYVYKQQFQTTSRPLNLSGPGSRTFSFKSISASGVRITSWTIALNVQLLSSHKLTVRLVDLGR